MNEYTKPTITHMPLVTHMGAGGTNQNACRGAGVPYTGSEGAAAGQCAVVCFIADVVGS
jgi:hypothetical protein